jgi:sugar/nucleoside kinase (ribokinase family)
LPLRKGEHGALLFGEGDRFFSCGAYPLEDIHDPTGAGDTFAGGMAGYLAGTGKKVHFNDLRKAMIYGSVLASFLRGSIQSGASAQSLDGGNRKALRDVQTDEPIRSAVRMITNEEYRNLLRCSLIATGSCILAVGHLLLLG